MARKIKQFKEDMDITLDYLVKVKGPLREEELALVRRWIDADWESKDIDNDAIALIERLLATCGERT